MREIVLDTETTGLNSKTGDRIVEIGCVELFDHIPTGKTYHVQINPERDIPKEATRVHGITDDMVKKAPKFKDILEAFLEFIKDDPLIIHNAPFDVGFLNMEFEKCGAPFLEPSRIVDTLVLARKKFPSAGNRLDDLCNRFGIDLSGREKHGALIDTILLADVYIELLGGRQRSMFSLVEEKKSTKSKNEEGSNNRAENSGEKIQQQPKSYEKIAIKRIKPNKDEQKAHEAFILNCSKKMLWLHNQP